MKNIWLGYISIALLCLGIGWLAHKELPALSVPAENNLGVAVLPTLSTFFYNFNTDGVLYETGSMGQSSSPYFWVNSGSALIIKGGIGQTVQGSLPDSDPWRLLYAKNNPLDTDQGFHPQNIFRLVTRSSWDDASEQAYFLIVADELSASPNRNASNGLLLFSHFQDSNNLYYAGVRVDGTAVIKKKINGTYATLAQKQIFPGNYDKNNSPNLLPHNTWLGLRTDTVATADGGIMITLYLDSGRTGKWQQVLSAEDNNIMCGTSFTGPGYDGIRTDFMDVQFEDFRITKI